MLKGCEPDMNPQLQKAAGKPFTSEPCRGPQQPFTEPQQFHSHLKQWISGTTIRAELKQEIEK